MDKNKHEYATKFRVTEIEPEEFPVKKSSSVIMNSLKQQVLVKGHDAASGSPREKKDSKKLTKTQDPNEKKDKLLNWGAALKKLAGSLLVSGALWAIIVLLATQITILAAAITTLLPILLPILMAVFVTIMFTFIVKQGMEGHSDKSSKSGIPKPLAWYANNILPISLLHMTLIIATAVTAVIFPPFLPIIIGIVLPIVIGVPVIVASIMLIYHAHKMFKACHSKPHIAKGASLIIGALPLLMVGLAILPLLPVILPATGIIIAGMTFLTVVGTAVLSVASLIMVLFVGREDRRYLRNIVKGRVNKTNEEFEIEAVNQLKEAEKIFIQQPDPPGDSENDSGSKFCIWFK